MILSSYFIKSCKILPVNIDFINRGENTQIYSTYSDLYKEVSQVFLEGRNILVEVHHALNSNLDLVLRQVREGSLEKVGHKALDVGDIVRAWGCRVGRVQAHCDTVLLHQSEHVC